MAGIRFQDVLLAPLEQYPEAVWDGDRGCFGIPGYRRAGSAGDSPAYRAGILVLDIPNRSALFFDLDSYERRRRYRDGPKDVLEIAIFGAVLISAFIALGAVIDTLIRGGERDAIASSAIDPAFASGAAFAIGATFAIALLLCLPFLIRALAVRHRMDEETRRAREIDIPGALFELLDQPGNAAMAEAEKPREAPEKGLGETVRESVREGFFEGVAKGLAGDLGEIAVKAGRATVAYEPTLARAREAARAKLRAAFRAIHFHRYLTGLEAVRPEGQEGFGNVSH